MGIAAPAALVLLSSTFARAEPPRLYRQPMHQSPVRGDPDDLLMLAGFGLSPDDVVVYRAMTDQPKDVVTPDRVPGRSGAGSGVAAVVSRADVPNSLTIRLPAEMRPGRAYDLWVRNARGEWSEPVSINDARPLWLSPAFVYASGMPAFLPREIKLVGRNLQPAVGRPMQLRFRGPQTFTLDARSGEHASGTLNRYVAQVRLPARLRPGDYRIEAGGAGSWIPLDGQVLRVLADPAAREVFSVSDPRFGGCRADDGEDDAACVIRAVAAARDAGGGVVHFGPGTWDLIDGAQSGVVAGEGIVVPPGIDVEGGGRDRTRLRRHREWSAAAPTAALTLTARAAVTGFRFVDVQHYRPGDLAGPFLQLGEDWQRPAIPGASAVSDVTIARNTFDKTFTAIGSGGRPIERLFIDYNIFGAYGAALELSGDQYNVASHYRIEDSVIDYNVFEPGSQLDSAHQVGALGSELGAGKRLDFSGNTADGASSDYLYGAGDARGWRAAFFWNLNGDAEDLLVSQNIATCTGDKDGDGEAFAFDNNTNTFAFAAVARVTAAARASIEVPAIPAPRQHGRDVPADYYVGHWLQIVAGPGLGQVRKITGYSTDPATRRTLFAVMPDFDVVPVAGESRAAVGREFWQVYVLDNRVDNRKPLCQKSNRSRRAAGAIVMWAQSADSVIEGNRQFDSDGILVLQAYREAEHLCAECAMQSYFQSFLEIRSNLVDGEYDWASDCSASGISIGSTATVGEHEAPPILGYGVSIAHNTIRHADAALGGAIAQWSSGDAGPAPHRWPLSDNLLIHHNTIADVAGEHSAAACGSGRPRIGIAFAEPPVAWRTVLYANSCRNVAVPMSGEAPGRVDVCPASVRNSCECGDALR